MIERFTIIMELLQRSKSKVGKTFIQKAVYILQDWLDLRLDYDYKLHFYGPYSSELADDIETLHTMELIHMGYKPSGYGYEIEITDQGQRFLDEHLQAYMNERGKIEQVISLVGRDNVRNMELMGTVLYFAKLTDDTSELRTLVNTVKPHFHENEIEEALENLKREGILNLS